MTSPINITAPIQQLINKIASAYEHEIIPVKPDLAAKEGHCYLNVQEKIGRDGGNAVYGWAVWLGEYICEGAHYAVWEDEQGNVFDITPRGVELEEILFIPDDRFTYEGKHIPNIRIAVAGNPFVNDVLLLSDMKDFLLGFSTRKDDGKYLFSQFTENVYVHYDNLFNNAMLFLKEGGKLGARCYCGSVNAYSQCHGKGLLAAIAKDKKDVAKVNA